MTPERETGAIGKAAVFLVTVAVFVGGLFDIGPILIVIGAPIVSLVFALEHQERRIREFLWGLLALLLGYGVVEWVGRLIGALFW